MLILLVIMLLAPALISVLLFERFKGYELTAQKRIALLLIFAFLINMLGYAVLWLRGITSIFWTLDKTSTMTEVAFCLKYMALSLVFAAVLPFVLSLVRIGKRK